MIVLHLVVDFSIVLLMWLAYYGFRNITVNSRELSQLADMELKDVQSASTADLGLLRAVHDATETISHSVRGAAFFTCTAIALLIVQIIMLITS